MRQIKLIVSLVAAVLALSACTSVKQMNLFRVQNTSYTYPTPQPFVISAGDELQILFSSLDAEAITAFASAGSTFIVAADGTALIPVIGKVALKGLTEEQAQDVLAEKIGIHAKNALVFVSIVNAGVTVLGEVASPQWIGMTAPISITTAIGMAGDFSTNARRDNVMVQRIEDGKINIYEVNLLTDDVFRSPCYYLQKGDIIYVSPLHSK